MALEDRVKELEEELKVLKNEIQTTLLDIQEQILSHYYPSLYPSANKEANLAQSKAAHYQAAQRPVPQQAPVSAAPASTAVPNPATTPQPAAPQTPRSQGKYKTQTVTLVEEPDEEETDDTEPFEEETEPMRLAVVPKHQKPKPSVNGHTPDNNLQSSPPANQELTPEDEAFLDAIVAKEKNMAAHNTPVSFDEFKELMQQKTPEISGEDNLFTEELLDDLLKDSLSAFNEENLNGVASLLASELPETEEIVDSDSIDKTAVRLTVRKLLKWVDNSIAVIGKDPTKQAVAMYVRAGDLSEEMHQTLLLLVDSSYVEPATEKAGIRQIIDTLSELNDILDHHTPEYLDQVMRFITEVNFG